MLEQTIIDLLKPVLQEWPTVAVLLVIGWALYKQYQSCQKELSSIIDWQQKLIEEMLSERQEE